MSVRGWRATDEEQERIAAEWDRDIEAAAKIAPKARPRKLRTYAQLKWVFSTLDDFGPSWTSTKSTSDEPSAKV